MDTTDLLRERMRTAALFGAALAALTPTVGCKADPDPADAGASGGSGGSAGTGGNGGAPVGGDPGYPLAQDPGPCPPEPDAGPDNMPLSGPCCPKIECYDPPAGAACPMLVAGDYEAQNTVVSGLGHEGLGSGECLCGVEGPWNAESAHAITESTARCCYTISIQWCTGRPLVVESVARVAPLVARGDWT
jgi:hypothetical protein